MESWYERPVQGGVEFVEIYTDDVTCVRVGRLSGSLAREVGMRDAFSPGGAVQLVPDALLPQLATRIPEGLPSIMPFAWRPVEVSRARVVEDLLTDGFRPVADQADPMEACRRAIDAADWLEEARSRGQVERQLLSQLRARPYHVKFAWAQGRLVSLDWHQPEGIDVLSTSLFSSLRGLSLHGSVARELTIPSIPSLEGMKLFLDDADVTLDRQPCLRRLQLSHAVRVVRDALPCLVEVQCVGAGAGKALSSLAALDAPKWDSLKLAGLGEPLEETLIAFFESGLARRIRKLALAQAEEEDLSLLLANRHRLGELDELSLNDSIDDDLPEELLDEARSLARRVLHLEEELT